MKKILIFKWSFSSWFIIINKQIYFLRWNSLPPLPSPPPSLPTPTTSWVKTSSSPNSHQPSNPPKCPKWEVMPMPPLPRPPPSRTSKRLLPLESLRDLMMDNHSSRSPERWRPSKECSHRSTIWREDSESCNPLSQSSRTPSRPSKRLLTSEEWERNEHTEFTHLTLLLLWKYPHYLSFLVDKIHRVHSQEILTYKFSTLLKFHYHKFQNTHL